MTKGLSAPADTCVTQAEAAVAEAFIGGAQAKRQQPSPTQLG